MNKNCNYLFLILALFLVSGLNAQNVSKVWVSDNGDGTYKNPVLHSDYSDPDAIRVGDDYYLISSSFNCVPALPILHSKDLVNWELIGHVFTQQPPFNVFDKPQHGNGVWAPAIRYHNNEFYIYYPDPDYGIYLVKAKNITGPWSKPQLIMPGKGFIDPCPFWDENGEAYLIHAYAGSRAGIKCILTLNKMNAAGDSILDDGVMVFDGHPDNPTLEGPKMYKRNGYYYIFAPAGGVSTGWQLVMRSKSIYGPYESKIVMDQGKSPINGPHQGAWVETPKGESWFLHFQDKEAYGRVLHLNPMKWVNDWPVIGVDKDGDGKGEPVVTYKKPDVGKTYPIMTPPESDEFDGLTLGLQWQWHANPKPFWAFPTGPKGYLRMFAMPLPDNFINFWDVPNLLLQKFPAPEFSATAKVSFKPFKDGERFGFIVMGYDYAYLAVKQDSGKLYLSYTKCKSANKKGKEVESDRTLIKDGNIFFKVTVTQNAVCSFSYSFDGKKFIKVGEPLIASSGQWIGAKVGMFCVRQGVINDAGFADIDWFRIDKP
jgi:beta-xylosidase